MPTMRSMWVLLALAEIGWEKTWPANVPQEDKIVGGFFVKNIREVPYVVSIQIQRDPSKDRWEPVCTGSVLSALFVITACHCVAKTTKTGRVESLVEDYPLASWLFLAGAIDVKYPAWTKDPLAQNRTPVYIRHHPECRLCQNEFLWNDVSVNDVALAKMSEPFDLGMYVKPVELFTFYREKFDMKVLEYVGIYDESLRCNISGWGSNEPRDVLDDLRIPSTGSEGDNGTRLACRKPPATTTRLSTVIAYAIQDDEHCLLRILRKLNLLQFNDMYPRFWPSFKDKVRETLKNQICVITKTGGPCGTDFGSALLCDGYILGITSWAIGCGQGLGAVIQSLEVVLSWLERECCTFETCQDVLYAISHCEDPVDRRLDNCTFPTTTPKTTAETAPTDNIVVGPMAPQEPFSFAVTLSPKPSLIFAVYQLFGYLR